MTSAHSIKSTSNSYSSLSSHIQASFSVKNSSSSASSAASTPGLDLQFSSSDPYNVDPDSTPPPLSRHQQAQQRQHTSTFASASTPDSALSRGRDEFPLSAQGQYPSLNSSTRKQAATTASATGTGTAAHPLSLTHKIAERKRAAAAVKENELRQKDIQKAFEARRELRNTVWSTPQC